MPNLPPPRLPRPQPWVDWLGFRFPRAHLRRHSFTVMDDNEEPVIIRLIEPTCAEVGAMLADHKVMITPNAPEIQKQKWAHKHYKTVMWLTHFENPDGTCNCTS